MLKAFLDPHIDIRRWFPPRYWLFAGCVLLCLASVLAMRRDSAWAWSAGLFGALSLIGVWDLFISRSTVSRNYPILARMRYFLESIGPQIRQYFIEADVDERPFSREQRDLVYQRATDTMDLKPFGTLIQVYGDEYEWINHSLAPVHIESHDFRVAIGEGRAQAYPASVFNISAMSFGAISPNAIRALNAGARRGGFYHDTGEGSISSYHRENGGDIVWEIGSGYFGCRNASGGFDEACFVASAAAAQVKMIEIKLSQGAKPGHGGVLPGAKVNREIAQARGVPEGVDCVSPARHSAFSTPLQLLEFVDRLRDLSGGKPVGFKLAIGHPWEWFGIARAMQDSGLLRISSWSMAPKAAPGRHRWNRQPCRYAAARSADAGAQHAGGAGSPGSRTDRCGGQDHQCIRHGADAGIGRGLVQCSAWLHVRAGLHPGAEMPYRSLSQRCRHPGCAALALAGCR